MTIIITVILTLLIVYSVFCTFMIDDVLKENKELDKEVKKWKNELQEWKSIQEKKQIFNNDNNNDNNDNNDDIDGIPAEDYLLGTLLNHYINEMSQCQKCKPPVQPTTIFIGSELENIITQKQ